MGISVVWVRQHRSVAYSAELTLIVFVSFICRLTV